MSSTYEKHRELHGAELGHHLLHTPHIGSPWEIDEEFQGPWAGTEA